MPTGKQRRSKRDPELSRRLDEVHNVMKVRRDEAERREAAMMDAVQVYLRAAGSIRRCTGVHDQRVSELRKRIEQLESEHEAEVARWLGQQAGAVAEIRDLGESDDSIGELLELTNKQVRQLMASARASDRAANNPKLRDRGRLPGLAQEPGRPEAQREPQVMPNADESDGQSLA
ncbi:MULTISPECIES: hypothetical protein [Nocardia]|uniref:Uncharacterized protein n=1 Tax=Nocardia fluminea TaxID=134984 RepID=A0A2N3VDA0_9NOCA|nr:MULTISPECIES: hypothetical protein [Nocardia]PKV79600.1 hypothetical protein ATK86_3998 [Nocardia fluminea]